MEPEEAEEFSDNQEEMTSETKSKSWSSWRPVLSEFAIATLVFVCFIGIIVVALGCVFLMILGWMSYAMFFLMAFGLFGCLMFLFVDPCSMMLTKRLQKRRRSRKNFLSSGDWTEMTSITPKDQKTMKKHRRRKNKKSTSHGVYQKHQQQDQNDESSDPSPDPFVVTSSSSSTEINASQVNT